MLCITQWVIARTHEQETGGSTNRLRNAVTGRNQLNCLFTPCLCLSPGPILPQLQLLPPGAGAEPTALLCCAEGRALLYHLRGTSPIWYFIRVNNCHF